MSERNMAILGMLSISPGANVSLDLALAVILMGLGTEFLGMTRNWSTSELPLRGSTGTSFVLGTLCACRRWFLTLTGTAALKGQRLQEYLGGKWGGKYELQVIISYAITGPIRTRYM